MSSPPSRTESGWPSSRALPPELASQALAEMPEEAHAEEMLAALDLGRAADIVEELDDDDAGGPPG